jgi:precorrin-6A/cobalt-precorrin-6A reductase
MILLLGGTSETAPVATRLAEAGCRILVSTATDEPLEIGSLPNIERRSGPLDETGLANLVRRMNVRAIVDCTHPYAATVRATARGVAEQRAIPYFTFIRPAGVTPGEPGVHRAANHEEAARVAFSFGRPVLLTTGANHLAPYAARSRETGLALIVRVLPRRESLQACLRAGIAEDCIISARGPFTVKENRAQIRRFRIGVLVTKDSGEAGGVPAKLEAARAERCAVVIVERPPLPASGAYGSVEDLVAAVLKR